MESKFSPPPERPNYSGVLLLLILNHPTLRRIQSIVNSLLLPSDSPVFRCSDPFSSLVLRSPKGGPTETNLCSIASASSCCTLCSVLLFLFFCIYFIFTLHLIVVFFFFPLPVRAQQNLSRCSFFFLTPPQFPPYLFLSLVLFFPPPTSSHSNSGLSFQCAGRHVVEWSG